MPATEFMVLTGMIIVGLLFFMVAQNFILGEGERTKESGYKAEAKSLVSLIERVSSEPNEFVLYCQYITLCNISIKNGILTYEKDEVRYSSPVPKFVKDVSLVEIATICIQKTEKGISLLGEKPVCIIDNVCTLDECKEDCSDCYGPNSKCIGDTFCNKLIGENCLTSKTGDCSCDPNECCPSSPDADIRGCSVTKNIEKGKDCLCTSQCDIELECNPTFPTFAKKACCDPGKGWDETDQTCKDLICDDNYKCPGAPMDGGLGDNAWKDSNGNICCPYVNIDDTSGPVCSASHCCPTNLPKWCGKPLDGTESRCMGDTEFNNECKVPVKLRILFVPVNWDSGWDNFDNAAQRQANEIIKNIPLSDCPEALETIPIHNDCRLSMICNCPDLQTIEQCARASGETYDYVVGLEDSDVCGNTLGFSCGTGVVFSETSVTLVATHELGHEWGLNDEYVDACICGFGLVNPNSNCLDPAIGGSDPVGGYSSAYCAGGSCPSIYTVTCSGNRNSYNGRCIMSYGNAPGPRAFCIHCIDHLKTIPFLNC